jgi:hypothetical protein
MNMGRDCPTALDEQIFEEYGPEYLVEVRDHYTADKVCFLQFPESLAALNISSLVLRAVSYLG